MIYTVTFNPSLDYIVHLDSFTSGAVNRTRSEEIYPGGKGINVSIVLKNLGFNSEALGFTAGFTGKEIEALLNDQDCDTSFIRVKKGMSRINVKVKAQEESEINGQGPVIEQYDLDRLYDKLDNLEKDDILVLAGSIPKTLPDDIYEKISEKLQGRGVKIVVDATGELLVKVLKYKPFLIKPNNHELEEIFKETLETEEKLLEAGKKLQSMGARNVLISRAGKGALLIAEDGRTFSSPSPKGVLVNSVGAGDSMVAGFIAGYLKSGDYREAFMYGIAAGSATAFSKWLADKELIMDLYYKL